jgi:hypothetical protein
VEETIYSEGDKSKILHKNNLVNWFTKWVNRFTQQKTTQECMKDETIQWMSESIQVSPWWRMIRFNLQMNRFSASQRVLWDDSDWNESVQVWYNSRSCESIHLYSETYMNRFSVWWVDSICYKKISDTFSQVNLRPRHINVGCYYMLIIRQLLK